MRELDLDTSENVERWRYVGDVGQPQFQGTWVNHDAHRVARFYRDRGRCYLEGLIKNGTINTTAFTLPPDCWPLMQQGVVDAYFFPCVSQSAFGAVTVVANGEVKPHVGNVAWFDLSGISFRVVE